MTTYLNFETTWLSDGVLFGNLLNWRAALLGKKQRSRLNLCRVAKTDPGGDGLGALVGFSRGDEVFFVPMQRLIINLMAGPSDGGPVGRVVTVGDDLMGEQGDGGPQWDLVTTTGLQPCSHRPPPPPLAPHPHLTIRPVLIRLGHSFHPGRSTGYGQLLAQYPRRRPYIILTFFSAWPSRIPNDHGTLASLAKGI